MADKTLDAKGLNCPLPILKAKKALKEVPDGGTLDVITSYSIHYTKLYDGVTDSTSAPARSKNARMAHGRSSR